MTPDTPSASPWRSIALYFGGLLVVFAVAILWIGPLPDAAALKADPPDRRPVGTTTAPTTTITRPGGPNGPTVTAREYGGAWPFTVERGVLECDMASKTTGAPKRPLVTFSPTPGIMYGLNGAARDFGYPDPMLIQKPGTVPADRQPLIDRGLKLCQGPS
jgi:hypothetical protein